MGLAATRVSSVAQVEPSMDPLSWSQAGAFCTT